ncbi:MAG TPA: AIPR family protein, partial [Candidatus Obscuribacterales bacterium]
NDPGHFLAFNNGISATVESLSLVQCRDGGQAISSLTGLQVVNGGQTMASIHRAKDRDKADLSTVSVQAKITVIEPDKVEELVPMISRCSNTQNKVNETDFSANHPFHVQFQELSERVWLPGESSRWFYERARGQYEVARNREGRTPARLKKFDLRTPKSQKLDKTVLCKALNAWDEKPDVVSRGGQKCFVDFMSALSRRGSTWLPDEDYYRDAIAKVILFKRAEKIARQIAFDAYRANAVAYTLGLLAYRCCGRLDLDDVWESQDVPHEVEETMRSWMPEVHAEIVESAGDRNVTEWCKKKECWAHIQALGLEPEDGLAAKLQGAQPMPTVGRHNAKRSKRKQAAPKPLSPEERERQAKVMKLGTDEWQRLVAWMRTKSEYAGFPTNVASTILGYCASGWQNVPSPRQTAPLVEFIDAWQESCDEEDESSDAP